MNQYKDHQDVSTLIGPPPGYQGYEIGGALTRPVIENPYRVIIMDEFEKSHPDVRHCFFDILDKAQCIEKSSGKTAHFGACAFFATCNEGVESLRTIWSEVSDPITRVGRARDVLAGMTFDKALLARFDDILLMDMLPSVVVAEVACLQIAKYWKQYGIDVHYAAPELLAETVRRNIEFADYGVRELARQIQEHTTPAIETARREGIRRVRLSVDAKKEKILVETA
jgi:ATP-dependent Clp protease ATP-binding subunit ClpA